MGYTECMPCRTADGQNAVHHSPPPPIVSVISHPWYAMKWFLRVALLLAVIAGTSNASEFVWREAENATGTSFNHSPWYQNGDTDYVVDKTMLSPGVPGTATTGDWRVHYANGTTSAYIEWNDINVTEGGDYVWWARLAPRNAAYQVLGGRRGRRGRGPDPDPRDPRPCQGEHAGPHRRCSALHRLGQTGDHQPGAWHAHVEDHGGDV